MVKCIGIIKKEYRYHIKDNKYGTINSIICKVLEEYEDTALVQYKLPLSNNEITEEISLDNLVVLDDIDCHDFYIKESYFNNHGEIEFLKKYSKGE